MADCLWQWSASDLARAIREKSVSSHEVIQAHLERIEAVNHQINAVTLVLADQALKGAQAADRAIAAGDPVGPLHGVPFTIKENIDLAGAATTHGIVSLKDAVAKSDAPVIAHLKRAGAIPLGRTNLPDFGLHWRTNNDLHGATLNPWDPTRTPGGSSGGEAAATAVGLSPLGVGNDMGGSLRYPAQCCGITTIRPSLGRVSRIATSMFSEPPLFYDQIAAVNGPMARHVKDLRLALEVMSQPDPGDPCWTPAPQLGAAETGPVRVALCLKPWGLEGAPAVIAGIREAADALADAGYMIEEVEPPLIPEAGAVIQQICDMEIGSYLPDILPLVSEEARCVLQGGLIGDTQPDLTAFLKLIGERYRIGQAWGRFFERHPLVLGPLSAFPPFKVGDHLSGPKWMARFLRSIVLIEVCNLLGLPSVALPVGDAGGLPQGVQLIGPRFHEDLVFDAAEAIERQLGVLTPIDPRQ